MQAQDLVSIPTLTPPLEFDQGGFRVSPPHPYFCPSAQYFVSIPTLTPPIEFDQGGGYRASPLHPYFCPSAAYYRIFMSLSQYLCRLCYRNSKRKI